MSNKSIVKGKFLAKSNKTIKQYGSGRKITKLSATRNTRIKVKKA